MKLATQLRLPSLVFLCLTLLGDFQVIAEDGFRDDLFWAYREEDVDGVATLKITNRNLTFEMPGKSMGDSIGEGQVRVAGQSEEVSGVEESKSVRTKFRWSSRYEKGVLTLDLDGHKLRVEDQGKTLHVGGKKIQVDGKRQVTVTVRADGTVAVTPKEAILP